MKFGTSPLAATLITTALVALAALCGPDVRAHARQTCPSVSIECPDTFREGEELSFRVVVADADPSLALTYEWSVSTGTITGGQGTASITVDATGFEGRGVTATVSVGGLPEGCESSVACATAVSRDDVSARLADSYGRVNNEEHGAHLDSFFDALQNEPGATGYIVAYAGRRARAGEAMMWGERAKNYLVGERQVSGERVVVMDGGFREELTVELFIVATGAQPPVASPTVEPSEVEIIEEEKPKPARKPKPKVGGATKPKP
ncbi:MAG TPA: hypothetical protein VFX96_06115 [Pyrinomonadaceae bacterium]|nr:hypothetical protein [Pyrinomonadaceae bacterium]